MSRAGMSPASAGTATARTNASIAARLPAATYPPRTEPNVTAKPTSAIVTTESQVLSLTSVATTMSAAPPAVRAT